MERIARIINFVAKYHEDHWKPGMSVYKLVDEGCAACTDATAQERSLVAIILNGSWNDAMYWAETVLGTYKSTPFKDFNP